MRRFIICLSLALIVLLGLVATMAQSTNAQEPFSTPGPDEFELAPGQIGRELASGRFEEPPAGSLHMGLLRVTSDPGSVSSGGGPDDPTGALILVESGAVTVRLEEPATITRTTGPDRSRPVAAGSGGPPTAGAPAATGRRRCGGWPPSRQRRAAAWSSTTRWRSASSATGAKRVSGTAPGRRGGAASRTTAWCGSRRWRRRTARR